MQKLNLSVLSVSSESSVVQAVDGYLADSRYLAGRELRIDVLIQMVNFAEGFSGQMNPDTMSPFAPC